MMFRWAERIYREMRLCWKVWAFAVIMSAPVASLAATCTAQTELSPQDRSTLSAIGGRLSEAVVQQDFATLQAGLQPAEATEWSGIRGAIEQAAPLVKGGQLQLRNLYLLDAANMTAPADTQFFCSSANGSLTVTIMMHALPPGRYTIVLADAAGGPPGGQHGLMLRWAGRSGSSSLGTARTPAGDLLAYRCTRASSTGMTAFGTGHVPGGLRKLIHGAPGTPMTPPDTCCCRLTLSPLRTWRSSSRSKPRSRVRHRKHFRIRFQAVIVRGRSTPCSLIRRCTSLISRSFTSQRALPIQPPCAQKRLQFSVHF